MVTGIDSWRRNAPITVLHKYGNGRDGLNKSFTGCDRTTGPFYHFSRQLRKFARAWPARWSHVHILDRRWPQKPSCYPPLDHPLLCLYLCLQTKRKNGWRHLLSLAENSIQSWLKHLSIKIYCPLSVPAVLSHLWVDLLIINWALACSLQKVWFVVSIFIFKA